jgi:hypothetical protein
MNAIPGRIVVGVGLKGMDEVLDKLRAVAGVDSGARVGVKK